MITLPEIEKALRDSLNPTEIIITDKSSEHQHHSGWKQDHITHIDIFIVSDRFNGQSKIQRHKLVYSVLSDFFKNGLHAASITAITGSKN